AYLPPAVSDNPDLNPIEKMRVWVKRLRKMWRLGCVDSLFFYLLWFFSDFTNIFNPYLKN
ncbi:hypothetical protein, partial [Neisseria iguanae]